MRKSFVLIILVAGVLAGCDSGGGGSSKLSADDVAVVGSEHVTLTDLNNTLNRAKIAYKQQGQAFPKQGTTKYQAIRDNVISLLVEQAELDQAVRFAVELGVGERPEEADRGVDELLHLVGRRRPARGDDPEDHVADRVQRPA